MKRKAAVTYKIIYDYPSSTKQYEEVKLLTRDRREVMKRFLELVRMQKDGTLAVDFDCTVRLVVEINMYIRNIIDLLEYNEEDDLNAILDRMERTVSTSYEKLRYTIKQATSSGFMGNYKTIYETENRAEALDRFLHIFREKPADMLMHDGVPDVVLEISISPFSCDTRCVYLKSVKDERQILTKLAEMEKTAVSGFRS